MEENGFTYRLFTVSELEDWLSHNVDNGLTDKVIARARALAFVHNPHAKPDDSALVVVYNNKEAVGYTGAFAEQWVRPALPERYFWGSTQWMDPQYRGKGVSGKMMRMIKDAVEDKYIALDSSPASCRLDEKQGSIISYYPRYFIVLRNHKKSLKSTIKDCVSKFNIKRTLRNLMEYDFSNRYVSWIDDETYDFIVKHSGKDLFLRKQDFLNWQIRHPFVLSVGWDGKTDMELCEFGSYVQAADVKIVQVYSGGQMCGFYVLNIVNSHCTPLYMYYDDAKKEIVFASLVINVLQNDSIERLRTFNKELYDFCNNKGIKSQFSKAHIEQISLTVPDGFVVDSQLQLQGGDGDMVC